MQIDWITVVAQIVNFLFLVWILRRLLYGPIMRAMAARETGIRERFAEAARREAEAAEERDRLTAERTEIEHARAETLARAHDAAAELRHRLEHEVREDVAEKEAAWRAQMRHDQAAFLRDLRHRAADHVEHATRRALGDLAGVTLEDAMVDAFHQRLRALEPESLGRLRDKARADGRVSVETAFDLPPPTKARLTRAIRELFGETIEVRYARNDDLLCGVRLKARGQTAQWSLDAYLDDLEEETRAILDADGAADAERKTTAAE